MPCSPSCPYADVSFYRELVPSEELRVATGSLVFISRSPCSSLAARIIISISHAFVRSKSSSPRVVYSYAIYLHASPRKSSFPACCAHALCGKFVCSAYVLHHVVCCSHSMHMYSCECCNVVDMGPNGLIHGECDLEMYYYNLAMGPAVSLVSTLTTPS